MENIEQFEKYFEEGGFLYNVYSEKNVYSGKCESEVTEYAVKKYAEYYKPYKKDKGWAIRNEREELEPRRQRTSAGCYLTKNKYDTNEEPEYLDIVGDILTSPKKPLQVCFGIKISLDDYQELCKQRCLDCIQKNINQLVKNSATKPKKELVESAARFVLVSHTIGNMIPIPEGLNTLWNGGGNGWDWIKHKVIKLLEYYEKEDIDIGKIEQRIKSTIIKKTLGRGLKQKEVIGKWYKQENIKSEDWKTFIENHYLQDIFKDKDYKEIKEEIEVPPKKECCEKWRGWFDEMTKIIIQRGRCIIIMNGGNENEIPNADEIFEI